ncbi:MAG: hypothetical protein M4579_000714 [Chaenotheca gracillima]|nr:MAG: hypothetical protein M4579_000714 [Chaenotheca gracillima]
MDSMQLFQDLPGIRFEDETSCLQDHYGLRPAVFDAELQWQSLGSIRSIPTFDVQLSGVGDSPRPNNMQRFLQAQERSTVPPNVFCPAHDLEDPYYPGETAPGALQSSYPFVLRSRGASPTDSWLDDLSLTDRSSCDGSVFSPRSSVGDMSFEFPRDQYDRTRLFNANSSLRNPAFLRAGFRNGPSAQSNMYEVGGNSYVDPRSVQQYPDAPELDNTDDETSFESKSEYTKNAEWYLTVPREQGGSPFQYPHDEGLGTSVNDSSIDVSVKSENDHAVQQAAGKRNPSVSQTESRRQALKGTAAASRGSSSRVSKRPKQAPLTCSHHPRKSFRNNSEFKKHIQTQHTRPFFCVFAPYSCDGTFGSKNEWKRHVNSQHLRLGFWRCNQGICTTDPSRPNEFNRKDLFTQHLRRMHCPGSRSWRRSEIDLWNQKEAPLLQAQCYVSRRKPPPRSQCGFCGALFEGEGSWDERMEHVGKHFESQGSRATAKLEPNMDKWAEDVELKDWLIAEGLIEWSETSGEWVLARMAGGTGEATLPKSGGSKARKLQPSRGRRTTRDDSEDDIEDSDDPQIVNTEPNDDDELDAEGESDGTFEASSWNV